MNNNWLRKTLKNFAPYAVAPIHEKTVINANESYFNSLSLPSVMKDAEEALASLKPQIYPAPMADTLREAIADYLSVDPSWILAGNGGDEVITYIINTFLDPEDILLTHAPTFDMYDTEAAVIGAKTISVPDLPGFKRDWDGIAKAVEKYQPKLTVLCNPNNPTGVVYDEATIKALAAIMEKKEKEFGTSIVLISDEPYRELAYGGVEVPFVTKYYHNAVVGYSYSKSLSVPGERIGYVVIPDEVDDSAALIGAATIANRVIGCVNAPSLIQKVIKYCIEHEVTVDLETYEKNRNLIYGALTEYGFTCAKPDGAFYLFVKSPVENEKEFCEVAKKHHVLVVPGSSFACPGYVRLAYCVSYEQIERSLPAFKEIAEEYGLCK